MDALVMAGGRGERLDAPVEKPLFEVGGRPMVGRVLDALSASRVGDVAVAVSPDTPRSRAYVDERGVECIVTPGAGYVADLDDALDRVEPPVLTVAADLPLLSGAVLDRVLDDHDAGSVTLGVPAALKERLDLSVDRTFDHGGRAVAPAGVNVVASSGPDRPSLSHDVRLAVNVNRRSDAAVAEALA